MREGMRGVSAITLLNDNNLRVPIVIHIGVNGVVSRVIAVMLRNIAKALA